MSLGYFNYPIPVNEPVLAYAPGSPEKIALKKALAELKGQTIDIPMYIGGEEVRTGNTKELRPPHETAHLLGTFHKGSEGHATQAINAALAVRGKLGQHELAGEGAHFSESSRTAGDQIPPIY